MPEIYTPDRWVVLSVTDGEKTNNRVFAGWYGGYLGSDSWKLNSGNVKEEELDNRWEFTGRSGSKYVCYKARYGMTGYMSSIFSAWLAKLEKSKLESIEIDEKFRP